MKQRSRLCFALVTCSLVMTGCNSAANEDAISEKSAAATTKVDSSSSSNLASSETVATPISKAEVTSFEAESNLSEVSKPKAESVSKVQAVPTTAIDAISVVNLLDLPRLNEKTVLQSGPTYLYYSGQGTLQEAVAFYAKQLESRGWKEIPPLTPPTEQFSDRLFEKQGHYLRASLSVGSEHRELGIMLANLGNIDVRLLPKLSDADSGETPSTPVNFTYKSNTSIPDAADTLLKKMTENGWQPWNEFQHSPVDVPHYRDLHFRKEACRLNVGILKNPQDPADKTTVFYHAEYVTPFDIPTTEVGRSLRLDLTSGRAAFEFGNSRKELLSLLQANSQKFGWQIGQADKFTAGEAHMLPIDVKSGAYVVARLVESNGKYSASIESFASAPKSQQPKPEVVAADNDVDKTTSSTTKDSSFDELNATIESSMQSEISKALGSINSPAKGPKDLAALHAMAKELANNFGSQEMAEDDGRPELDVPATNPFDVPEDEDAPTIEIQSIKKSSGTIKYAGNTYQLDHVACYVVKELGEPKKCILFSDSPINVEKLRSMLLEEGKPVYGMYACDNATNVMNFRINENGVSIDANIGSISMGIATSEIQTSLSYYQGKIIGRIDGPELIKVNGSTVDFAAEVSQPVLQIDWTKRGGPESKKLLADQSKEFLIPEGCSNFSSEGSRYSKKIEATIKAPLEAVQAFYDEQTAAMGWKTGSAANGFKRYLNKDSEMELKLESMKDACTIQMLIRNSAAAKADDMLPPAGKAMLVLGNLSDSKIQMTIVGKTYDVYPSDGQNPKDATKVVIEPGSVKIQVLSENGSKKFDMKVDATADSTWGVLFDTSFQDVLRLF